MLHHMETRKTSQPSTSSLDLQHGQASLLSLSVSLSHTHTHTPFFQVNVFYVLNYSSFPHRSISFAFICLSTWFPCFYSSFSLHQFIIRVSLRSELSLF